MGSFNVFVQIAVLAFVIYSVSELAKAGIQMHREGFINVHASLFVLAIAGFGGKYVTGTAEGAVASVGCAAAALLAAAILKRALSIVAKNEAARKQRARRDTLNH
ncbi:hypothetical protein IS481_14800 [Caldimonas thermodepolymerans]|uniref:hypothetical protein n=1 Tax=Caldimonas thermodepolymerans TaxID=215580 RepID=UPI0011B003EC|nr:hypothetical protein [Caldimonas thermodepolymerans]QPC30991.1 hypothetical protein IS481_14800 [Caldimonas thermodepolymerans]